MAGRYNGGPAFPVPAEFNDEGMTLRDWFAGQVLAGISTSYTDQQDEAEWTYSVADAMLAERAKVERGQAPDPTGRSCADTVAVQPAPAPVPHCRNCGLVLGSDRPYCDVCGCLSTTQGGKLQCTKAKGHVLHHLNGCETWYGDKA